MSGTQSLVADPPADGTEISPEISQSTPIKDEKPKYKFMKLDTTIGKVELVIAGMCGLFLIIWLIIGIQMLLSGIESHELFSPLYSRFSDYSCMIISDFLIYKIAYIYSIIYAIAIPGLGIAHYFLMRRDKHIFDTDDSKGMTKVYQVIIIIIVESVIFFLITAIPIGHIFAIKKNSSRLGNINLEKYDTFNNYYNSYARTKIKSKRDKYNKKIKGMQNNINDYKREMNDYKRGMENINGKYIYKNHTSKNTVNNFKYVTNKRNIKMQKYLFDKIKKKNQPK